MTTEAQYRNMYINLKAKLKQKGWDTKEVDSRTLRDYAGMNPEAAKAMGAPVKRKTFEIDGGMSWEKRYCTLVHEVNETRDMEHGKTYWDAHCAALKDEFTVGGIP